MGNRQIHPPQDEGEAQSFRPAHARRTTSVLPETTRAGRHTVGKTALPDLRGLLLVALVAAWLAGILVESLVWVSLWLLLLVAGVGAALAALIREFKLLAGVARWLTLVLLLLGCGALGAARLALSNPTGDPAAVSSYIGRQVTIRGNVGAEPDLRSRSLLLEVDASSLSLDNGRTWRDVHGTVAVLVLSPNGPYAPEYGDSVELRGLLEPVVGGSGPAASASGAPTGSGSSAVSKNARPLAAPAGVFASMTFPSLVILERGGGNPLLAWLFQLRQRLAQAISQSLPEPEASLLIGILLGLKTPVLRSLYPIFQKSGTVHLVVTSGFKVTILSGMLATVAQRIAGRRWATVVVVLGILLYTILSGAGPAAIRAGVMGIMLVITPRAGRYYNTYTALALAALVMSVWSPYVLWDVGFQLSTLGTLGIALLSPLMTRRLERHLSRIPGALAGAEVLAATLAAQLATWPVQVISFGQLSLIAPLANLLAVPLLGALLALGVFIGTVGLLLPTAGAWAGWVCWPLLALVYQIIAGAAALPFAGLNVGTLDLRLAWLYELGLGLLIVWLLSRPRPAKPGDEPPPKLTRAARQHARQVQARWRLVAALFVLTAAGITTLTTQPDQRLHLTWLDVGPHGQAILIQTPGGHTALIDGGSDPAALEAALGQQFPFWQRTIDLALLTNPKSGHLPGLLDVLSHYHIVQAADAGMLHPTTAYATWRVTLEQRQIPYARIRQGTAIQLEPGVTLQVLSPGPTLSQTSKQNDDTNALILRLVTPGLRVLLLGETDETALDGLAASGIDLRADIVQIALQPDQSPEALPALADLLPSIQPAMIVVTPASATTGKASSAPSPTTSPETIRTFTIAATGTLALTADSRQWWLNT
jgi:competence protein ComEC